MIRIITDSTADIPREDIQALGVRVVPLQVNIDGEMFRDGLDLEPESFYEMLAGAKSLPTTSQPSPEQFLSEFEQAKQAGDEVVCITLSGELSGTLQSAMIAREDAGYAPIHIVDSRNVTLAEQLLVRRACHLAAAGLTAADIAQELEAARGRIRLRAIVDTLKYLHKGGRLSGAAALAGGLLGVKPVVGITDGKLGMLGKARGMAGAYVALFKLIEEQGGIDEAELCFVGYTGSRAQAAPFVRFVTQNLGLEKPPVMPIGTVIGTHAGPGAAGIAFFAKEV